MVRKGEILSQAVSGIGDDLIEGAKELFEKSESEITQAQNEFAKKKRAMRNKLIYAFSAAAAAAETRPSGRRKRQPGQSPAFAKTSRQKFSTALPTGAPACSSWVNSAHAAAVTALSPGRSISRSACAPLGQNPPTISRKIRKQTAVSSKALPFLCRICVLLIPEEEYSTR